MPKTKSKKTTLTHTNGATDSMLKEFFIDQVKDIYWVEKHLVKALTKMEKEATTEELKSAFADHRSQTEVQAQRLDQVFEILETKPMAKKCDGMEGLIKEAEKTIEETDKGTSTRDVGLIIGAQKVEHYEISAYGSMVQLAGVLGYNDIVNILNETLEEEKQADVLLTQIAENNVNYEAATEEEEA